jgi:hypothetical protein
MCASIGREGSGWKQSDIASPPRARAVLTTPEGKKRYRAAVAKLLDTVFQPVKVQARARELAAAIRPAAVGTDAGAATAFDTAVTQFCEAVAGRATFVAEQLKAPSSRYR